MDGRVVGHTIDPRTARPVDHEGASVSVIAETA
ncbi:MAG: FAD:protein FMN transferase [Burkholderiaceae bacterium]